MGNYKFDVHTEVLLHSGDTLLRLSSVYYIWFKCLSYGLFFNDAADAVDLPLGYLSSAIIAPTACLLSSHLPSVLSVSLFCAECY